MSLSRFRRTVITAGEREPALAIARKMRDGHVGCVVVTRDGRPIGIVTDRDLTLRVMAEGRDPAVTPISEVVTYDPILIGLEDGLETAAARMHKHGIRRLPVVDAAGVVVGMVTSDDLMVLFGRELADLCEGIDESADASDSR